MELYGTKSVSQCYAMSWIVLCPLLNYTIELQYYNTCHFCDKYHHSMCNTLASVTWDVKSDSWQHIIDLYNRGASKTFGTSFSNHKDTRGLCQHHKCMFSAGRKSKIKLWPWRLNWQHFWKRMLLSCNDLTVILTRHILLQQHIKS